MQRQNRNNPVYNQELSGKTNYLVANLIPLGKNNAISTEELLRLSGFESMTDLQRQVDLELKNKIMRSHCRSSGKLIDSDCTGIQPTK